MFKVKSKNNPGVTHTVYTVIPCGTTPETRLKEKDKRRHINYQHYTGRVWGTAQNYDICLNSGTIGIEACVDIIVDMVNNSK